MPLFGRHHHDDDIDDLSDRELLVAIYERITHMANTEALTAAVAANTTATDAAVTDLKGDTTQAAVDAATTQITANTDALTAATPQPPAPVEPPVA